MNECLIDSFIYLSVPAEPCSNSLPVSDAPAVPLAIPFFLASSAASFVSVPCLPGSTIFSVISLFTAVGSCSLIFAGVIGSFSLYSFKESSFLPVSVPGAPSSNVDVMPCSLADEEDDDISAPGASLDNARISSGVGSVSLSNLALTKPLAVPIYR